MPPYSLKESQLRLMVKVKPNARNTEIKEITDTEIIINVSSILLILGKCIANRQ